MLIISSDLIQFDNLSKLLKGKLQQGLRVVNDQFPLTYTIFYVILKYDLCNDIHGLNLKKTLKLSLKLIVVDGPYSIQKILLTQPINISTCT